MGEAERARLEAELERHYAARRESAGGEAMSNLVAAMLAEDARASEASDKVPSGCARASEAGDEAPSGCARASEAGDEAPSGCARASGASDKAPLGYGRMRRARSRRLGAVAFVAAQVRYIPVWTWAAQVALVAIMCVLAYAAGDAGATKVAIGLLSAMTVLVGVPTVQASKLHGVAELEYSCPSNAASVMVARLVVLGCSSALVVGLMVAAAASSLDVGAFDAALWACPPFFLCCAGSLMALRKAPPAASTMLCVAWAVACSAVLLALASTQPDLYAHASLTSWAVAAAVACSWLAREVAMTLRAAAGGLDAFSPHLARTYN